MKPTGVRIIKASYLPSTTASGYDYTHSYMHGYTLDEKRLTAVLMRQSRKGADEDNPESRLRQENLPRVAVDIRADHDRSMVREYDEGSGMSGQKKIYERPKLLELWEGIQNGTIGSVIVAREDRLFRDQYLTQPTTFVAACVTHKVILIVAGRRAYDFRISDDFKAFIAKMQESYGYIEGHVKYMYEMKLQKLQRGEWVGGDLIAPYALNRAAMQIARNQRKQLKEYGEDAELQAAITQAFRPVIYETWHAIAVDIFQKYKLFDFSRARLGRWIEDRKYVFPLPSAEDLQKYVFKTSMQLVPGFGYTFSDSAVIPKWITNLMHLGYASAGRDEDGNRVYIEGAFGASIDRETFEECYEATTGYTLDGQQARISQNRSRFVRKNTHGHTTSLLKQCLSTMDDTISFTSRTDKPGKEYYIAKARRRVGPAEVALSKWDSNALWSLPVRVFDHAIVDRLTALALHDTALAERVEAYYGELNESRAVEKEAILQDMKANTVLIAHYDRLLANPAQPLTVSQEKRYLQAQADAEHDLEKAQAALTAYEQTDPSEFIPAFYRILGNAPGEFWQMDIDRQRKMLRMLIETIELENISPHLYTLRMKWKDPIAVRWDCALLFRRNSLRSNLKGDDWTADELAHLQAIYPTADKLALHQAFPMKSGEAIKQKAAELGVKRAARMPEKMSPIFRALCYADWTQACAQLGVAHESEEGHMILQKLNTFARTTERNSAACWWLLPVMEMADFDDTLTALARPEVATYVVKAAKELAALFGASLQEARAHA